MLARSERYEAVQSLCTTLAATVRAEFYDDVTADEQAALERCADALARAAQSAADVARHAAEEVAREERRRLS